MQSHGAAAGCDGVVKMEAATGPLRGVKILDFTQVKRPPGPLPAPSTGCRPDSSTAPHSLHPPFPPHPLSCIALPVPAPRASLCAPPIPRPSPAPTHPRWPCAVPEWPPGHRHALRLRRRGDQDRARSGRGPGPLARLGRRRAPAPRSPTAHRPLTPLAALLPPQYQYYNQAFNRGKRSLALDIRRPESRAILEKLVQWADVIAENMKTGEMDALGLGYDNMKQWNPAIIYATNSGFGAEGEWAERGSFDLMCQAFSGATVSQGGGPSHVSPAVS